MVCVVRAFVTEWAFITDGSILDTYVGMSEGFLRTHADRNQASFDPLSHGSCRSYGDSVGYPASSTKKVRIVSLAVKPDT